MSMPPNPFPMALVTLIPQHEVLAVGWEREGETPVFPFLERASTGERIAVDQSQLIAADVVLQRVSEWTWSEEAKADMQALGLVGHKQAMPRPSRASVQWAKFSDQWYVADLEGDRYELYGYENGTWSARKNGEPLGDPVYSMRKVQEDMERYLKEQGLIAMNQIQKTTPFDVSMELGQQFAKDQLASGMSREEAEGYAVNWAQDLALTHGGDPEEILEGIRYVLDGKAAAVKKQAFVEKKAELKAGDEVEFYVDEFKQETGVIEAIATNDDGMTVYHIAPHGTDDIVEVQADELDSFDYGTLMAATNVDPQSWGMGSVFAGEFKEEDHPRDKGKFAPKGQGDSGASDDEEGRKTPEGEPEDPSKPFSGQPDHPRSGPDGEVTDEDVAKDQKAQEKRRKNEPQGLSPGSLNEKDTKRVTEKALEIIDKDTANGDATPMDTLIYDIADELDWDIEDEDDIEAVTHVLEQLQESGELGEDGGYLSRGDSPNAPSDIAEGNEEGGEARTQSLEAFQRAHSQALQNYEVEDAGMGDPNDPGSMAGQAVWENAVDSYNEDAGEGQLSYEDIAEDVESDDFELQSFAPDSTDDSTDDAGGDSLDAGDEARAEEFKNEMLDQFPDRTPTVETVKEKLLELSEIYPDGFSEHSMTQYWNEPHGVPGEMHDQAIADLLQEGKLIRDEKSGRYKIAAFQNTDDPITAKRKTAGSAMDIQQGLQAAGLQATVEEQEADPGETERFVSITVDSDLEGDGEPPGPVEMWLEQNGYETLDVGEDGHGNVDFVIKLS